MNPQLQRMFAELDNALSSTDKRWIEETTDETFIRLHFTLGSVIRNKFVYASEDSIGKRLDLIFGNPDGVSSLLSKLYWWHLLKMRVTNDMIESALDQHLIIWSDTEKAQGMEVLTAEGMPDASHA
jgi:hypothetical protein